MNTIPIEDREARLLSQCASEIEPERVEWIWDGRIAVGKHTCIAGEPGTGKSQLATFIAATISTGERWPCSEGISPRGSVLILSAEDGAGDTLVPRLIAAGADLGRVHVCPGVMSLDGTRAFNLQADLALLEKRINELGDVLAVIVDPISSYLGKTDSHKNAEVRQVLEPLAALAARTRVAVLSVTHFSKAGAATSARALHRFIGSIAFVGAPRMAFAVIEDSDDSTRRLLLHAKNNLAPAPQGLAFCLRQVDVGGSGIIASRVAFEDESVDVTADGALAASTLAEGGSRDDARDFLRQALADGPVDVKAVNKQAEALGISGRTLKRARADLGVKAIKSDFEGGWMLHPPAEGGQRGQQNTQEGHHIVRHPSALLAPFDAEQGDIGFNGKLVDFPDLPACLDRRKPFARLIAHDGLCLHCGGAGCHWCHRKSVRA